MTKMTSDEAKNFVFQSATNAQKIEIAVHQAQGCKCKAYEDIFSFKRWKAQGVIVPKGGISVLISLPKVLDTGLVEPEFINKRMFVWCRCQINAAQTAKDLRKV